MRANRAGSEQERTRLVAAIGRIDGPAGLWIDAGCPCHLDIGLGRDELPAPPIDDIQEAVLGCGYQHVTRLTVNGEVGKLHVHIGVIVPALARIYLIVPLIGAALAVERDDRGKKQIVALALAADFPVPWRAVARPQKHGIRLGVVAHCIPNGAAPAVFPPLAEPSLGGHLHGSVLEAVGWIAWHDVEAP